MYITQGPRKQTKNVGGAACQCHYVAVKYETTLNCQNCQLTKVMGAIT